MLVKTRARYCLNEAGQINTPYLRDACWLCCMWSSVLEKEDGNAPVTAQLYEMAALESSIMRKLPIVSHYSHQVPTKQTRECSP